MAATSTSPNIDWKAIRAKLPTARTQEEKKKRMELFQAFGKPVPEFLTWFFANTFHNTRHVSLFSLFIDPNGNGYLSLAEVDKGCKDVLGLYEIFDAKPVIMRAFQAAKSANDKKNKAGSHGPDYIEKCEFRLFLVYIRQYFEIWQIIQSVDTSGDRRISFDEFESALSKIESWGLSISDPKAEFVSIDKNGGGMILFDEFADWALVKNLDLEDDDDFEDDALP